MKITRAVILDFGKFHQREVYFSEGLHLVTGENESGKSTFARFLRSMLYGLERERGVRARKDDYTKYRPWEYGRYQGILEFEDRGTSYRLFRNFLTTEKQVTLTNLSTGEEIEEPEVFLQECGLVSETVYINTCYVGNLCATETDLAGELKSCFAGLAGTGGAGINLQESLDWLEARRREKRKSRPEKELGDCMSLLMRSEEIQTKKEEASRRIAALAEEQHRIEEAYKNSQKTMEQLLLQEQEAEAENEEENAISGRNVLVAGVLTGGMVFLLGIMKERLLIAAVGILLLIFVLLFEIGKRQQEEKKRSQEAAERRAEFTDRMEALQEVSKATYEKLKQLISRIEQEKITEEQCEEQLWQIELTKQRYQGLSEVYEQCKKEEAAIELAADTLKRLSRELYQEYGVKFAKALSGYAQEFTDGAYNMLTASDNLELRVVTNDRTLELSEVSFGTGEQFYLALRFAALEVFDPEKRMFVVLDDSFASFDVARMESAMLALARSGRQILLLSCSGREEQCASALGLSYEKLF